MKEYQVEFIFIGIIILGLAIWKISEMVKTRCYQKQSVLYEGFLSAKVANAAATLDTNLHFYQKRRISLKKTRKFFQQRILL